MQLFQNVMDLSRSPPAPDHQPNFQELCDLIYNLGGILACYVVSLDGKVLGYNFGSIIAGKDLRSTYGMLASDIWRGLKNVEAVGGPILVLAVTYQNFKVVGIPIPDSKVGIIATVPVKGDEIETRNKVLRQVDKWGGADLLGKGPPL